MLAALIAASAVAACKVDHARYVLRTQPGVTAEFRDVESGADWPSGLAVRIRVREGRKSYWFLPWNGGADGLQHLASTTDVEAVGWRPPSPDGGPRPLGDIDYIATDRAYGLLDSVPRRGDAAPAHILLPNLEDHLWHHEYVHAAKQFFDLVGCARAK